MDKLLPFFPLNKKVEKGNVGSLVITLVIYIVVAAVLGFVVGMLRGIPIVGLIFGLVSALIGIYELVGIILAVITFVS